MVVGATQNISPAHYTRRYCSDALNKNWRSTSGISPPGDFAKPAKVRSTQRPLYKNLCDPAERKTNISSSNVSSVVP